MRPEFLLNIGAHIQSDCSAFSGSANSAVTGAAVQRQGPGYRYDSGQLVVATGTATGSPSTISVTGKLQDSADGSTGWADVLGTAITAIVAQNSQTSINFIARGCNPYLRVVITPTLTGGSSPAIPVIGVLILGGNSESDG
jgi:hypothetical protein